MSLLVVMGSGETAPTMVRVHREVFAATPAGPAVFLDTTFGFQLNADELITRTAGYFRDSVGHAVQPVTWRRSDEPPLERARSLAALHEACWAFAGPGSPTYALRQWRGTPVPAALAAVADRGGTLVFGSAAACTLGPFAVPVYEIYKAGEEPRWEAGLDLLGSLTTISAVVIPHFDNNEGGSHDTRFCYLGEERLRRLEQQLPDEVGVLGVDEHTALLLDLDRRTARVAGNGTVTVRRRDQSRRFASGEMLAFDDLAALLRGEGVVPGRGAGAGQAVPAQGLDPHSAPGSDPHTPAPDASVTSLRDAADAAATRFGAALAARDVDGCVAAILDVEQALADWSSDTLQSDDADHARRTLRSLVVRLGDLAVDGARDRRTVVAPYVEALLELRTRAREAKDFVSSDLVRARLAAAGVEVRDTTTGVDWLLADLDS